MLGSWARVPNITFYRWYGPNGKIGRVRNIVGFFPQLLPVRNVMNDSLKGMC